MGVTNWGNQDIQWNYYDPLNSDEFDKHHQDIIPAGIYKGGLMERLNDTSVRVYPLVCEISDGTQSARIKTAANADIAVAPTTPYIILRWEWQPLANWYMDIMAVAVGDIEANDIIVGKCVYSGSVMTGITYLQRNVPKSMEAFLRPRQMTTPEMKVFVESGWLTYGNSRIAFAGSESPTIVAPVSNPRIDLIYIDAAGNVQVASGDEDPNPVAPSHANKIAIAEVRVETTSTVITDDMITDARPWINLAGLGGLSSLDAAFMMMGA